jgi:hypothetical protein
MADVLEKKEKENKKSDIFITEDDTFNISIKYYNKDGKLFVKKIDEDFDDSISSSGEINIILKYPSQGDCMSIERSMGTIDNASDNLKTFLRMEYTRFIILARKWNLPEKMEEAQIVKLHPKIIKGIFQAVREKIDLDGLL